MTTAPRMICIWCPDWPVTTARLGAGLPADAPVAVIAGAIVLACSHTARERGVRRGQRRREAQSRCPEVAVLPRNEAAEARAFEPLVVALEAIAPGVEITRPGLAAIGARGPTRYFGGETGVLHALSSALAESALVGSTLVGSATSSGPTSSGGGGGRVGAAAPTGDAPDVLIGVADGAFAAGQAARRGMIVAPGGSAAFLADLPVDTLDNPPLVDLLRRLGLRTLGAFAALPARDVLARFGPAGAAAYRQAGGADERPVAGRPPPTEFAVTLDLEPALERVDAVAFSARGSAERFVAGLADHGWACACLELQAVTENGEQTVRRWRHAGVLGSADVLDRVRWQLEGWLCGPRRPTGGVVRLRLIPVDLVPTGVHQQSLWGGSGERDERACRALARVQTLLGHGGVLTPVRDGGRDPAQRSRLVPWGDEPVPVRSPEQPWPGALPAPAPTVLLDPPRPARVLDDADRPVIVTDRGLVPHPPARFALGDETPVAVTAWAGPWPVDERWWQPESARHAVRCQLVDVRGRAYLVSTAGATAGDTSGTVRWQVDAIYD